MVILKEESYLQQKVSPLAAGGRRPFCARPVVRRASDKMAAWIQEVTSSA